MRLHLGFFYSATVLRRFGESREKHMTRISRALLIVLFSAIIAASQTRTTDNGWPRKFAVGPNSVAVYQPQLEEWVGNSLSARAAIAINENQNKQPLYGVLWFSARAEIDKINRLVTLSDFKVKKLSIPMAPDKAAAFQLAFEARTTKQGEVIALDRLLADMAINHAATNNTSYEVKNDPPQVLFSTRPAILVLIDGAPVLRPVKDTGLERVVNTRVLLLRDLMSAKFYLHLMDGWMESTNISGPWTIAGRTPPDLGRAVEAAIARGQVDLLDGSRNGTRPTLAEAVRQNTLPAVFVSTQPAELLQTQGEPQVAAIEGTNLIYVTNTEDDIFIHTPSQDHFILLSGRWFKASSMMGPWQYVDGEKLPADFAKIPATHQRASVLVSVPGTPQAKEALIANAIPQTATITRSAATVTVNYDGAPQFKSIESTTLKYAVNTSTPVIRVDIGSYYAVQNGVWFVATSAIGPWTVATSVPVVIYTIPVSSPLHYVTYVKIYGSTPEVVYVGYTPGYYGTVVTSRSVVLYGTGWYYPPYVGAYWYGAPYTYGYGAAFTWGVTTGWGVGTRAAWANPYTGNVGRGGAYAGVNPVTGARFAAQGGTITNVYTGNSVAGARGAAYNPQTGVISGGAVGGVRNGSTGQVTAGGGGFAYNTRTDTGVAVGNNNVYATKNGDVYRYNKSTGVQQKTSSGWEQVQRSADRSWVQNQQNARGLGEIRSRGGLRRR